ncbi:hypothetical protein LENED_008660 [Lentinula edodes]|uniref:Uncharacterized protein n=1 Tax=Lentinula edodes TaxID=5353 RepID=A0A1Q3EHQ4_LENED|nr:hypothetical protein LENED_008660 [Lentinula edodes]
MRNIKGRSLLFMKDVHNDGLMAIIAYKVPISETPLQIDQLILNACDIPILALVFEFTLPALFIQNEPEKTVFDGYPIALFLRSFIELYIDFLRCAESAKYGRLRWLLDHGVGRYLGRGMWR